jgi:nondiscriminating aspartyl-tRNA synthetase
MLSAEKCEFEDPSVILERFGLQIGGVPPFGPLLGLDTYYDTEIADKSAVAFNCGLATESILMKGKDLIELVDPKWGSFSKNNYRKGS